MPKHNVEVGEHKVSSWSSPPLELKDELLLLPWYLVGVLIGANIDEPDIDESDIDDDLEDENEEGNGNKLIFLRLVFENKACKRLDLECFLMGFLLELE